MNCTRSSLGSQAESEVFRETCPGRPPTHKATRNVPQVQLALYDDLRRERLASGIGFTASPVAADGKVYFTSEEGEVYVIQAGAEYKLLSVNKLGEICMASPAVSEGVLYFRTQHHLLAVGP